MAYRGQNTKYGNLTTSQIATNITGMQVGDSVFNTDYGRVDFYTGSVWTNNNSITITAGATITEGQICRINASGQAILLGTPSSNAEFGVGICGYGGTLGQTISLIVCGVAKCRVGVAGVTLGQYATISSTAGSIVSTTAASIGALGRVLQTQTSGNLAYVMLSFIERA